MILPPGGAGDSTIPRRAPWTPRSALASGFCVVGAIATTISGGSACTIGGGSVGPTSFILGPVYRLNAVNGQALPAVFKDSGGVRSRVFADTLRFSLLSDHTYSEAASVGTQVTGQNEIVTPFVLADTTLHYTQSPVSTVAIPRYLEGSAQGTLTAASGPSPFTLLTATGQSWVYVPVP